MKPLTIAIDGPASSGKGTIAKAVAQALGFSYVDSGAMYRSVALHAQRCGISWADEARCAAIAEHLVFDFLWDGDELRVRVDGEDITDVIRTAVIGRGASDVSKLPAVRAALLGVQRELGTKGAVVMDGRDIGTVIFPNAEIKIYLDAELEERALRRHAELVSRGGDVPSLQAVQNGLGQRDRQDRERSIAPLRAADDALTIDTTRMDAPKVVETVLGIVMRATQSDPSTH
jgi:cytidylate kinase